MNVGGGAMSGPPAPTPSKIEERHDSLGARRTSGGVGGHVGAPPHRRRAKSRSATIHSGRDERWGGAMSAPPAPTPSKIEERDDSLGARRMLGGVGGHVGPPAPAPSKIE